MSDDFPFDVDESFWDEVTEQLESKTDYDREEIKRGLTFMLGRRARTMLESLRDGEELIEELEVAITHSRDDK